MASWTIEATRPDIQVVSRTQVRDVQVVTILTSPHGAEFELAVPVATFQAGHQHAFIEPYAEGVEWLAAHQHVAGVRFDSGLDATGLIKSFMVATVQVPTPAGKVGPFETEVTVPLSDLGKPQGHRDTAIAHHLTAAVQRLDQAAGIAGAATHTPTTPVPIQTTPATGS